MKKKKRKQQIILGLVFLLLYSVILFLVFVGVQKSERKAQMLKDVPIVDTKPSAEVTIEERVVAEKLDLQRKIIQPSSPQKVSEITRIVRDAGGEVIKSSPNMIVAHIPKESESDMNEALESSNSASSLEVDYPTFLAADNPDWGVARIKAPDVWETTTATGIKVAVIDTGIDYNHQELRGRYAGGYDTANNDSDPFDDHGHGTHVAGIVATSLDGSGLAGVSPGAQILAVKALGADGTGYISDVVEAVDWAMRNGAQVMNFSLGSTYNSSTLENKLNEAASRGIVLVAAAGNTSGGSLLYPAAYGSVISVAATDSSDNFASFSSVGAELAAPGVGITSTVPGNGYATWSGTSMASPHVAATVALMLSNGQSNIRQNLQNTAIDLGPAGKDGYFGYGLVHAKPATLGEDVLAPVVTFLAPGNNETVYGDVNISLDVQDENELFSVALFINNQKVTEWGESPFSYTWDTTGIEGNRELLVKAVDEYENVGEAKITVNVSKDPITPTPTVEATPTLHQMKQQGESQNVRQDTNQEQAAENRQDYQYVPKSPQEASTKSESASSQVPEVSNINERNQKPDSLPPFSSENARGRGVRGVSTSTIWESLRGVFERFLPF